VGISVIAAVITPSADAFSMAAMATPLVILYFLSIFLVRMVEKKPLK
jgi:Sec-independent protein secretion pathway component TatC